MTGHTVAGSCSKGQSYILTEIKTPSLNVVCRSRQISFVHCIEVHQTTRLLTGVILKHGKHVEDDIS